MALPAIVFGKAWVNSIVPHQRCYVWVLFALGQTTGGVIRLNMYIPYVPYIQHQEWSVVCYDIDEET